MGNLKAGGMQEVIKEYLAWKGIHAPKAAVAYRPWIERFDKITQKNLADCGIGDVVQYHNWLQSRFAPRSIQYAMIVLHNFFDFWKKRGVDCLSPDFIKIPKARSTAHQTVSEEDYLAMLSILTEDDFWTLQGIVIIRMLHDCGMRVGELCSLNIANVGYCMAVINSEKTDQMRQVFWDASTQEFVNRFLAQRMKMNNSPAMFVGRFLDGTPSRRLSSRSVQRLVKRIVSSAGLSKKITPHSFRHGKAHRILDLGGSVKSVQCILGHQNPASSFAYLQFSDMETKKEAEKYLAY